MLNELKFVQGSVAKKGFVPDLTHFRIENGTVRGYNGSLALSAELGIDLTCTPIATPLIKAIQQCDETIKLTLTPKGKLSVRSGKFRATINCIPETEEYTAPHALPEGERFELDGESLVKGLTALQPFVSDDAAKPWSNGIMFMGQSMFATNNVIAVEYWSGTVFPFVVNLPRDAVKEIVRIKESPIYGQWTDNSITLHYESGKWIRCQLLSHDWPPIQKILDSGSILGATAPPDGLFESLEKLKSFTDSMGRCIFLNNRLVTSYYDDTNGAEVDIEGLKEGPIFNINMLNLVGTVATTIDFSTYPKPCLFYGDNIRGAIIGLKA
jgi:DNA polymerase III sliding clamp (beta) subunit (PCNA family)